MSARRIARFQRSNVAMLIAWFRSIPHAVGFFGGVAGIAFTFVFIGNSFGWWDTREIEPVVPSELVIGDSVNITGKNLDLVSGVQLSKEGIDEPIFHRRGNQTRLTINVPNNITPDSAYNLEFVKQGKGVVATGLTSVISPTPTGPIKEQSDINFADLGWKSAQIQNSIAREIIEVGYGHKTNSVPGPISRLWDSLYDGSIQVMMEVWLPNYRDWWEQGLRDGSVIPLGKSLDENWQSSFVIPTYMAEKFPGLRSVEDIPEYAKEFATGSSNGKAVLHTCLVGWVCSSINTAQVKAYGLEEVIESNFPPSEDRLFGSLKEAYESKNPWLGYLWEPTQVASDLDLILLDEPPYTETCWDLDKGCAYPTSKVRIVVHPSMIANAPEVMEFLRKWDMDTETQIAIEEHFAAGEEDLEETAVWFLRNFEIIWLRWVTPEVFDRVKVAVAN